MSFTSVLNGYCYQLDCSNKDLAEQCGISPSALSRYRSGNRTPSDLEIVRSLAHGIAVLAQQYGLSESMADEQGIYASLSSALSQGACSGVLFGQRLDMLMVAASITNADMARYANVDPSYLSRIRKGQRNPYDIDYYATTFSRLMVRRLAEQGGVSKLPVPEEERTSIAEALSNHDETSAAVVLATWLSHSEEQDSGSGAEHFLSFLDDFDLNTYLKEVRYDELKVPTSPLVIPRSRFYYGVDEMRKAELEFLKVTATARDASEVIMYSDLSMVEMSGDAEFVKHYIYGVGAMLKRGMHLSVIHDLTRPFDEMMMGLEGFIPLYMTGQISPYYLRDSGRGVFCQLINSSEVALLEAECIRGSHNEGRYYFSSKKEDVAYGRTRANRLLEKAMPLMEIYRADNPRRLARFERAEQRRKNTLEGTPVGEDIFCNLRIISYTPDLVVVSKLNDPVIHFEIRHPRLCDAIAHIVPAFVT